MISEYWQDDLPNLFIKWDVVRATTGEEDMEDDEDYALTCEVCGNVDSEPFYPARPNGMVRCGACGHTFYDPCYDPDPDDY